MAMSDVSCIGKMVSELQSSCFHGEFTWEVEKVSEKMTLYRHGERQCYHSRDFYIKSQTYMYRMEMDLNGTGDVVLRLVTLQGPYDTILTWPPPFRMRLSVMSQYGPGHLTYTLFPNDSGEFAQPEGETFIPLDKLCGPHSIYVRDDAMFIKVTKLKNPVSTTFSSAPDVTSVDHSEEL